MSRELRAEGQAVVNHKRVYRVMRERLLLLERHTGKPRRTHDGVIITLKSNLRWCSDGLEIRCWNGDRVNVAFSLDTCDREVMAFVVWTMFGRERDLAEDIGGESLLNIRLLESLAPVCGGELENTAARPAGQQAEEVTQVSIGLDAVHLAAGEQGDERGVHLGGVVVADEQPVFAPDGESQFILPMSASSPWCTIGGTRSSGRRSESRIASIVEEKTSSFSRRQIDLARCCRHGCSMPPSA